MDRKERPERQPDQLRKNFREAVNSQLSKERSIKLEYPIDNLFEQLSESFDKDNYVNCVKLSESILSLVPSHFSAKVYLIRSLYFLYRSEESFDLLEDCLKEKPDYFVLWIFRGDIHLRLKKYYLAIQDYQTSLKLKPDESHVYDKIAQCYFNLDDTENAHEYIDIAINMEQDNESLMLRKALFYEMSSDLLNALEWYQKTNDKFPANSYTINKCFQISSLLKESDRQQTDELFNKALEIVLEEKAVSTSLLQRKLMIGYAKAARLVDMMEERGVCTKAEDSLPRRLLISKENI